MKRVLTVFVFVFMLSIVAAENTTVYVQTDDSDQLLLIRVKDVNNAIFDKFSVRTGDLGAGSGQFSTEREMVNFLILYIENGDVSKYEEAGPFNTGGIIELDLRKVKPVKNTTVAVVPISLPVNETKNESVEVVDVEENLSSEIVEEDSNQTDNILLTGLAVFKERVSPMAMLYGIAGIFVIIGIFMFLSRASHARVVGPKTPSRITVSAPKSEEDKLFEAENKLLEAEKEFKEAESQIGDIRSKRQRLADAERQAREAQDKLNSLRGGM